MSFWTRTSALALLVPLAAVAILLAISISANAADRDVFGDWVISGGETRISNETIDVRGNVLIREGGALVLENSTLTINGSVDGERSLEVNSTGRLEAYDSEIHGSPGRFLIRCYNDTLLKGCTVHHIHGSTREDGMGLFGGDIAMRDCTIRDARWGCVAVHTDLVLVNVTFTEIAYRHVFVINTLLAGSTNVRIEGCTFDGHSTMQGRASFGLVVATYSGFEDLDVYLEGSRFEFLVTGVNIACYDGLTLTAEDCEMVDCWRGFEIHQTGSTVALRRNVLRQANIQVTGGGTFDLTMRDNLIEHADPGLTFDAVWAGSYECDVEKVTLRNCTQGVVATGSGGGGFIDVAIRNSTLEDVSTGFIAGQGATISIHDTLHTPGSGRVTGTNAWIRAYITLDIRGVHWVNGPDITSGALRLRGSGDDRIVVLDVSALAPREVLGWERTIDSGFTNLLLNPGMLIDDHWFRGLSYDIWNVTTAYIQIIDDFLPSVVIAQPLDMTAVNRSRPVARGVYEELGSGIARFEFSLDGVRFHTFATFGEGTWNVTLPELTDGEYVLSIRATDKARNMCNRTSVRFVVDTVMPVLDIPAVPPFVNTTYVTVAGRTEPNSFLTIDGDGVPVMSDGTFEMNILLGEGPNELVVEAQDRAGNVNRVTIRVVRDTVPPRLEVTQPVDSTWWNGTWAQVLGRVDADASLTVMGLLVEVTEGAFCHRVDLTEGEFAIRVEAADLAGNLNTTTLNLLVDWTPPRLTISSPEVDPLVTRELDSWMAGEVEEPNLESLTINEKELGLFAGGFSKLCRLLEGPNVFSVVATDMAGNSASRTLTIVRDITPPVFEVTLTPLEGELLVVGTRLHSTSPTVEVVVIIDEPASIALRDGTALPPSREHRWAVHLDEGRNPLVFDVVDEAGNLGEVYSVDVLLDTAAPVLIVYEPRSGSSTSSKRTLVHGLTEEGATLRVGEVPVAVGADGAFQHYVDLELGPNELAIVAVDAVGNANSTVVTVERVRPEDDGAGLGPLWTVLALVLALAVVLALGYILAVRRRRGAQNLPEEGPAIGTPPPGGEEPPEDPTTPDGWEEY